MITKELNALFWEATNYTILERADPSRLKYLRPSQLPFCAAGFFYNTALRGRYRTNSLQSSYFTSIGTAVHEVLQKFYAPSGKLLADWECKICGKRRIASMKNKCCGAVMKYHEITINHKGVKGHIDAVFKDSKGQYWILDFKTTSVKGILTKLKKPGQDYIEQIEAYALMLYKQYGIKVKGVYLQFVTRDSIFTPPVICGHTLDEKDFKRIEKRMKRYMKTKEWVLDINKKSEVLEILEMDKCKNPYCPVCRKKPELRKDLMLTAYQRGKSQGHLPIRELISKMEIEDAIRRKDQGKRVFRSLK